MLNSLIDLTVALDASVVQLMLSLLKVSKNVKGGCGVMGGHILECLSLTGISLLNFIYVRNFPMNLSGWQINGERNFHNIIKC